jgi:hypothetical protein
MVRYLKTPAYAGVFYLDDVSGVNTNYAYLLYIHNMY